MDAYLHVSDPDALAAEFSARNVEFFDPLPLLVQVDSYRIGDDAAELLLPCHSAPPT